MHINRLDLNLLLVFDELMATRNLTAAAARLSMSQPTMSHALARLRRACGDPLFVRTAQGMEPTPYALQIAEDIGRALELIRGSFGRGAAFEPQRTARRFRILMSDIGETVFLPGLAAHLRREAPLVDIVTSQIHRDFYRESLQTGIADLAIGQLTIAGKGFHQEILFEDHFVCLVRRGHPRVRAALTREAFQAEAHVVVVPPGAGESIVERTLARLGITRRIALQVPHYLVIPQLVTASDYVVTLPSRAARGISERYPLRTLPAPFRLPAIRIGQLWHDRNHDDLANAWLRRTVSALFLENAEERRADGALA